MASFATGQPRLQQNGECKVDVVAAQQDVLADGDTPDIGDRTKSTRPYLEETEIGGSAADIDDEDMRGL